MNETLVVLPWRPAPSRLRAYDAVREYWAREFPDLPVTTIDTDDDPFVLAACRNAAMRSAPADTVVILGDADTLPEPEPLREAIAAARESGLVHLPYTAYHWLGADGSAQFYDGAPLPECTYELVRGACSGIYVATPRTWAAHGGQDEGFRGWGFEDAAWNIAHRTLLGADPVRHEGRVYALHHVGEVRAGAGYDANAARMQRYRDAAGDPVAIRQLVDEVPTTAA